VEIKLVMSAPIPLLGQSAAGMREGMLEWLAESARLLCMTT
jgi:hypothetical protein